MPDESRMQHRGGRRTSRAATLLLAILTTLYGCAGLLHGDIEDNIPELAEISSDGHARQGIAGAPGAEASNVPYWKDLNPSAELQALLQELADNNLDIQAAAARLEAVRESANIASGQRWPSLSLNLDGNRQKRASSVSGNAFAGTPITETVTGVASVDWELDVWGGLALGARAAMSSALQQSELLSWQRFSLQAQFSKLWLDAIEARQQWQLAQKRQENLRTNLDIIESGFKSGIREALDVYSAQAEYAGAESNTLLRAQVFDSLVRSLEVLLGRYPAAALKVPASAPAVQALPATIALSMLERRPDLRAGAYAIAVQHSNLGIAKINRLPGLNIRANWGASNESLHDVLKGDDLLWNVAGSLTAPLFRGGQLAAQYRREQHLLEASIADYKNTVLLALQEVEQALANEGALHAQLQTAERANSISRLAEQQAFEAYVTGISNINTWLQAQRTAFDRSSQLVQLQSDVLKNRIDLYLALGGGFTESTTK